MVWKAINAETKTNLRSSIMAWDLNIYYSRSHYFSHATFSKVLIQRTQESKLEKFRSKNLEPTLSHDNITKPAKKKIRKIRKKSFDNTGENILGSRKNKTRLLGLILLRPQRKRSRSNTLTVTKKAIMQIIIPSFQKISVSLGNLYASD